MSAASSETSSPRPGVSGTRKTVSLVLLLIALVVGGIEMHAVLGQALTMRAFGNVSKHNGFDAVSLAEAEAMLVGFPSELPVEERTFENVHHYQWYSLLRPLTGKKSPELFVTSNHQNPPAAVSFYTEIEDFAYETPHHTGTPDWAGTSPITSHEDEADASGQRRRQRPASDETAAPLEPGATVEPSTVEPAAAEESP